MSTGENQGGLRRELRFWEAIALSIGIMAPTAAMALNGVGVAESWSGAVTAPDLTHVISRRTLAAGTLLNNPGNLAGWIQNPQVLKPGNQMPNQNLSAQQLSDTVAYLETLQ